MTHPTTSHLQAAKRILRYLKGTTTHGLSIHASPSWSLQGYTNADWASCPDDRRSTSGFFFFGTNLISWSSTKQRFVSRSSIESEYRALALLAAQASWVQYLLKELCIPQSDTPLIWCDNISVAALAANSVFHAHSKHIEIDLHFVRNKVLRKELLIQYVPSTDQLADVFTKHVPNCQFSATRTCLSIVLRPVSLQGDDRQTPTSAADL